MNCTIEDGDQKLSCWRRGLDIILEIDTILQCIYREYFKWVVLFFFSWYSYVHLCCSMLLLFFYYHFFLEGWEQGIEFLIAISHHSWIFRQGQNFTAAEVRLKDHKITPFIWMHKYVARAFQIPSPWVWYRYWNSMTSMGRLWFQYILKVTSFQNFASEKDRNILFSIFNNYLQEIKI